MKRFKSIFSGQKKTKEPDEQPSSLPPLPTTKVVKEYRIIVTGLSFCVNHRLSDGWCNFVPFAGGRGYPTEEGRHKCTVDRVVDIGQISYTSLIRDPEDAFSQYTKKTVEGCAICFNLRNRKSFDELVEDVEDLKRYVDGFDRPVVLVGADGVDGRCDCKPVIHERKVAREEGEKLAGQLGVEYFEVADVPMGLEPDSLAMAPFKHLVRECEKKGHPPVRTYSRDRS